MFMLMDDIGALSWHFGKKLIVSNAETGHAREGHSGEHKEPPCTGYPAFAEASTVGWVLPTQPLSLEKPSLFALAHLVFVSGFCI
jgi:hypothetical protein